MATWQHAQGAAVAPDFLAEMEKSAVLPLWDRYHELLKPEPVAPDRPIVWHWDALQKLIERAAREVSMADAERRVLMLVNPDFGTRPAATTNLFAGLQILEPGESARPHRHTASALRLVIESEHGATVVNGHDCPMKPGDLILTPNWAWHSHYNRGTKRVVWLDGLDLPLAANLGAIFAEGGDPEASKPNAPFFDDPAFAQGGLMPAGAGDEAPHSPMFRYPWTGVLATFHAMAPAADGSRRLRYTNPVDGGPVMPTMDCYAMQLEGGRATTAYRTTANAVCLAVDGEGTTTVGDKTIRWRKHDVFTLPHWNWISHKAASGQAHLFQFTDREVLRRAALLREEVAG